jgi:GNAT superfamily N-acetyltransferase
MRAERQSPSRHDLEISPEEKQDGFFVEEVEQKDLEAFFRFMHTHQLNEEVWNNTPPLDKIDENITESVEDFDPKTDRNYAIKDNGKIVAIATLHFFHGGMNPRFGMCIVDEEYRGKGLAKLLTDTRIETAKQSGAKEVSVMIDFSNPISLTSKFI